MDTLYHGREDLASRQEKHGERSGRLAAHIVSTLRKQKKNRKWGRAINPQVPSPSGPFL